MELPPPPPMGPLSEMIQIGGHIDSSIAGLRLIHDDLDPDLVTRLLGCEATHAYRKGDLLLSKKYQRVAWTGLWSIDSPWADGASLEAQINGLLDRVTDDLSVWEQLSRIIRGDIFCGIGINAFNRGFSLSPILLKRLGERFLTIDFDIYCNGEEDTEAGQ